MSIHKSVSFSWNKILFHTSHVIFIVLRLKPHKMCMGKIFSNIIRRVIRNGFLFIVCSIWRWVRNEIATLNTSPLLLGYSTALNQSEHVRINKIVFFARKVFGKLLLIADECICKLLITVYLVKILAKTCFRISDWIGIPIPTILTSDKTSKVLQVS